MEQYIKLFLLLPTLWNDLEDLIEDESTGEDELAKRIGTKVGETIATNSDMSLKKFVLARITNKFSHFPILKLYPLDLSKLSLVVDNVLEKLQLKDVDVNEFYNNRYPDAFARIVWNIFQLRRGRLIIDPSSVEDFLVLSRFIPLEQMVPLPLETSEHLVDHHVHIGVVYTPIAVMMLTNYASKLSKRSKYLGKRLDTKAFDKLRRVSVAACRLRERLVELLTNFNSSFLKFKECCSLKPNLTECLSIERTVLKTLFRHWRRLAPEDREKVIAYIVSTSLWTSALVLNDVYRGLEIFSIVYSRSGTWKKLFKGNPTKQKVMMRRMLREFYSNVPRFLEMTQTVLEAKISASDMYKNRTFIKKMVEQYETKFFLSYVKRYDYSSTYLEALKSAISNVVKEAKYFEKSLLYFHKHGLDIILGPDVAGVERSVPNWVALLYVESSINSMEMILPAHARKRILVSFHAGESYFNIINGLRHVLEVGMYLDENDRIGHGIALFDNKYLYSTYENVLDALLDLAVLERVLVDEDKRDLAVKVSKAFKAVARGVSLNDSDLDIEDMHLVWNVLNTPERLATFVSHYVWLQPRDTNAIILSLYNALNALRVRRDASEFNDDEHRAMRTYFSMLTPYLKHVDLMDVLRKSFSYNELKDAVETLRVRVIETIKRKKIKIEVCPTSNVFITNIDNLYEHPYLKFLKEDIETLTGSDDPSVLNTFIHVEEALLKTLKN